MTVINGRLNSGISGVVRFTPDAPFVDFTTTPSTLVSLPIEAAIANGSFSITVPQSQRQSPTPGVVTEGITYAVLLLQTTSTYTFNFLDGTPYTGSTHLYTDGLYYTGSVHDATSRRCDRVTTNVNQPVQDAFHAVVPDSATAIDFTSLMAIPIQQPYLDISAYRLAETMTTVPLYRDRISAKFNIKGAYAINTFYVLNDIATFNGNSYVWRNATSQQNQQPPTTGDNANWLMMAAKGSPGGTGAAIVGYNAANWAGSSEAAARSDVKDAITSIPNPDLSTYLTIAAGLPRSNPVMSGSVKRGQLTFPVAPADRATEIPTAQYIEDAIAQLTIGNLLPAPLIFASDRLSFLWVKMCAQL